MSLLPIADKGLSWDASEAKKRIAKYAGGPDKDKIDWGKYGKGFFWSEKNPSNFGDFKLPFADVIDGTLKAIPKGIYSASAAIQGARGGVDIPKDDIEDVKRKISSYYSKMGEEPPWKKEQSVDNNQYLVQFSFPIKLSGHLEPLSEVQLAKEGSFEYPGFYGSNTLKFDQSVYNAMIKNFNDNVWGSELSVGLPFDVEHMEYLGAFGWIKSLYTKMTDSGLGLFAQVEWTKTGKEFIQEGRFKYTSLTYFKTYKHPESGKVYNYVVTGAALTTKPFLTGMEPVSLNKFKEIFDKNEKEVKEMDAIKQAIEDLKNQLSKNSEILESYGKRIEELSQSKEDEKEEEAETDEELKTLNLEIPNITEEVKKVTLALQEQVKKLAEDNKELQEMNIEAECKKLSAEWFDKRSDDGKESMMKFKPDQRETVESFLTTLTKVDRGLITFSEASARLGKKLSESFIEIINGMPNMTVDLSEKGHNDNEAEIQEESNDIIELSVVEKYMKEKNIDDFAQALNEITKS